MNSVPDAIVQHIISLLRNARDIASCTCVSRCWKESIPFVPALYFPRNCFDSLPIADAEAAIGRMISSILRLEELIVYCPFSAGSLASWLALHSNTLRVLELRLNAENVHSESEQHLMAATPLACIGEVKSLEELKLWGVSLTKSPNWISLLKLRSLEIVGAVLNDSALQCAIKACPSLTDLALLGCDGDGVSSLVIELESLQRCRLDLLGPGNCSLFMVAPRLEMLEIQGFSWIRVHQNHLIQQLCIAKNTGRVYQVDIKNLRDLKFMSLRGVQWSWTAISSIMQSASEVKHLIMKIEFCGDFDALQPFPEVDLVEFFNNHPKLQKFEIHGALFASLCQHNSLRNVDSRFVIPCLEEVLITVRSPLNAEQKLNTLESLLKYSVKLRKMTIRISQMKNCHETADDFFEEICKLMCGNNKVVQIE